MGFSPQSESANVATLRISRIWKAPMFKITRIPLVFYSTLAQPTITAQSSYQSVLAASL